MSKRIITSIMENLLPLKHVFIDEEGLCRLAQYLSSSETKPKPPNYRDYWLHPQPSITGLKKTIDWIFFLDLLNFSFWTEPGKKPFTVEWKGERVTGYATLCAVVKRAEEEMGIPLVSPSFYGNDGDLDWELWKNVIFKGIADTEVPLLKERFDLVKHAGTVLQKKFQGSFLNCLEQAKGDIYSLIDLLIENFPSFKDAYTDEKKGTVWILKRAQILIADIWSCFDGEGPGHFHNIDEITMFADYRVPQSLQYFGVLKYSKDLLKILASDQELPHNSQFELEIRAASILAVQRLLSMESASLKDSWNAITIDFFLWDFAKANENLVSPYLVHKTRVLWRKWLENGTQWNKFFLPFKADEMSVFIQLLFSCIIVGGYCYSHHPFIEYDYEWASSRAFASNVQIEIPFDARLVHLSPILPEACILKPHNLGTDGSSREIVYRSSVHFSLFGPIFPDQLLVKMEERLVAIIIPMHEVRNQLANIFIQDTSVIGPVDLNNINQVFLVVPEKMSLPYCYITNSNIKVIRHAGRHEDLLEQVHDLFVRKSWWRTVARSPIAKDFKSMVREIPRYIVQTDRGDFVDASRSDLYQSLLIANPHLSFGLEVNNLRPRVQQLAHAIMFFSSSVHDMIASRSLHPGMSFRWDFDFGAYTLFVWLIDLFETKVSEFYPSQLQYLQKTSIRNCRIASRIMRQYLYLRYKHRSSKWFYRDITVNVVSLEYAQMELLLAKRETSEMLSEFELMLGQQEDYDVACAFSIIYFLCSALPGTMVEEDISNIPNFPRIWKSYFIEFHRFVSELHMQSDVLDLRPTRNWGEGLDSLHVPVTISSSVNRLSLDIRKTVAKTFPYQVPAAPIDPAKVVASILASI